MDAAVLPYHWDDRAKLSSDYLYLRDFHERLLRDVASQLNKIHRVDHSLRYWRILVGPWLGYFTQMLFDRWTSVQQAVSQHELSGTVVLTGKDDIMVPNDMADFNHLFLSDEWNHHIYAAILQQFTSLPCIGLPRQAIAGPRIVRPAAVWREWVGRALASSYVRATGILTRDGDAFFLATYLSLRDEMRLQWRLGQVPQRWRSVPAVRAPVVASQRRWIVAGENRSEFEACARALIPRQIPTVYLEGYDRLVEQAAGLPWPKRPKLIWTSNAYHSEDVFKVWAAAKVQQGAPLILGQHGGCYGVAKWLFVEDHEIAISDRYISWGWTEPEESKVEPVGQLKAKFPLGIRHSEQPNALLVTVTNPRLSYHMYSTIVARQWLDYFEDQCDFVENLPAAIRAALIVRLYPQDFGWDQAARWHDRFPDLQLDQGQSDIDNAIRKSRLYISSYNATTYLESLTMDVPTIMYWNPKQWELRDSAAPFFKDLERVGIFHETPESAARHVASIWDDVDAWWSSPEVRDVRERFKGRFCRRPVELLGRVEQTLREAAANPDGAVPR